MAELWDFYASFCDCIYDHTGSINYLVWSVQLSSVQLLSHVWLFATPWIAACQASLSITNSQSLLKLMSIELVMPSSHFILCRSLLLLPPIPPSIRVFSNESALCMRWPKYWSFSFSISPSNEHPGLISFRMDWLDLLVVQGTLKSLLQHHSSKASIFRCSAFFTVQLSHPYMFSEIAVPNSYFSAPQTQRSRTIGENQRSTRFYFISLHLKESVQKTWPIQPYLN